MSLYAIDKLMEQTRQLAADYRKTTGNTLPVTVEIAKYDAIRLLELEEIKDEQGIDAIGQTDALKAKRIQIKGRVIFDPAKKGQRLGQLNTQADWDLLALVLLDAQYEPFEVHLAEKQKILDALNNAEPSSRSQRGSISVAKFKALATLAWDKNLGGQTEPQIAG